MVKTRTTGIDSPGRIRSDEEREGVREQIRERLSQIYQSQSQEEALTRSKNLARYMRGTLVDRETGHVDPADALFMWKTLMDEEAKLLMQAAESPATPDFIRNQITNQLTKDTVAQVSPQVKEQAGELKQRLDREFREFHAAHSGGAGGPFLRN